MFAEHDAAIDTARNFAGGMSNGGMKVVGGDHTIPGGSKFIAPKDIFGNTCTDFDANEAIWGFFEHMGGK
jgi:poly(3-hydroxybutyrate) depolymerase